ncbi:unnamed protein product [Euphydryas editha]|uniref:Uncharacterized protein n=1 Tax=Euphydryas editha TaxID=104508 RepID=A0AAU9U2J5_EUPED|nr:unnamed protein product [Euphydryas editha]
MSLTMSAVRAQLEAANRQLRGTRQFVEEQAAEREAERDEFDARLRALRDENQQLAARLLAGARVVAEVEQLEAQAREMNQMITDLEARKAESDEKVKATEEKIPILREIIANLESQLEQKTSREGEVLQQLESMRAAIDDRDRKMRAQLAELQALRGERLDRADVCARCASDDDKHAELLESVKDQARLLAERLAHRARRLERAHERGSLAEERTEDVSLRDRLQKLMISCCFRIQNNTNSLNGDKCSFLQRTEKMTVETHIIRKIHCRVTVAEIKDATYNYVSSRVLRQVERSVADSKSALYPQLSPRSSPSPRGEGEGAGAAGAALAAAWERLAAVERAEDAALKRVADLEMQRAQLAEVAQKRMYSKLLLGFLCEKKPFTKAPVSMDSFVHCSGLYILIAIGKQFKFFHYLYFYSEP